MPDLTITELARRHGVHRSTMSRALTGGRAAVRDPARPEPVNPGEPQLRFRSDEVDAWWPTRPSVGRRAAPPPASEPS